MSKKFLIKPIINADLEKELEIIGFDKSYRHKAINKFRYKTLKIYGLSVAQANILKQTSLTVGADCGTNKNVITGNIETSDVILGGSFSQLEKISQKLTHQPFSLGILGEEIKSLLKEKTTQTKIMGILNITDNSFSDGGEYNSTELACEHFKQLVEDGADIIDIGAESTKPLAPSVSAEVQLEKILPILEYSKNFNVPISIDTRSALVAEKCLELGADIINDVSGLKYDKDMASVIAKHKNATLILQHSLGSEINMSEEHHYKNVVDDVFNDLYQQIEFAKFNGIENIILDVGIGFDKSRDENFEILRRIEEFYALGYPMMTGISRKSTLGLQNAPNEEKDIFTVALNTLAVNQKVDFLRVHNVKIHKQMLKIMHEWNH